MPTANPRPPGSGHAHRFIILTSALLLASPAMLGAAPPLPVAPTRIDALVSARAFVLAESFRYEWYPQMRPVTTGLLLVLDVQPALVYPRQSPEPVLYVGDRMAQRVGPAGRDTHRIVVIVPGDVDLAHAPIWFGAAELPERVTPDRIRAERALADAAGIGPIGAAAAAAAFAAGGEAIHVRDFTTLGKVASELHERLATEAR